MGKETLIVCLANSRRPGGHCIAGKVIDQDRYGEWVRPVPESGDNALSAQMIRCDNGRIPQLMDLLSVCFEKPRPFSYQTENICFDESVPWCHVGKLPYENLDKFVDTPQQLWVNSYSSSFGINDRVPEGAQDQ